MFWFAKSDSLVFGQCVVQQTVLLDQVQQNWMVLFLKLEGPEFPGFLTKQAKRQWPILMIGRHYWRS
jgi:hypothetical protein